ncbi:nucleoside triphosphate pyrophosphohydrolase [compost metagenome]
MKKIELLSNPNKKPEAAFLAICSKAPVWKDYEGISEQDANKDIPLTLMINRWDGLIGFPGGQVEDGETAIQAAVREAYEEVGVVVQESEIQPLASYEFSIVAHLFVIEISYEQILSIYKNIPNSKHFGSEITGAFLAHLCNYKKGKGIRKLLDSGLAKSVREELIDLMNFVYASDVEG